MSRAGARDSAIHANTSSARCIEPIIARVLKNRLRGSASEYRDSPIQIESATVILATSPA
jgi:hypothetical protein